MLYVLLLLYLLHVFHNTLRCAGLSIFQTHVLVFETPYRCRPPLPRNTRPSHPPRLNTVTNGTRLRRWQA
ncbi:hypothetical protein RSAG8_02343, partial [Rhizoctonia solani AG-8 WAC10335]